MKIDLLHNKIVRDTLTEAFRASVMANLVPLVEGECGMVDGIAMYEDYIADGFLHGGRWYYPLTVIKAGEPETLWVSWEYSRSSFVSASPYSYSGTSLLDFEIADELPEGFAEKLRGRAIYYDESAIKVNVRATADDPLILSGRYSQTFVDELARQITRALNRAMSVRDIASGSIELELVFAPGTYMEHTSENVTYRRLLLVDKTSQPRDFWVKWTRIHGGVAYTACDDVTESDILFELGEDVSQKIREKEYRFLCSSNPQKYQSAMGKKTVTEWREVVKRAIKRGEIEKVELVEEAAPTEDVSESLRAVLDRFDDAAAAPDTAPEHDDFSDIMEMARRALDISEQYTDDGAPTPEPEFEIGLDLTDDTTELPEAEDDTDFLPPFEIGEFEDDGEKNAAEEPVAADGIISVLDNSGEEFTADLPETASFDEAPLWDSITDDNREATEDIEPEPEITEPLTIENLAEAENDEEAETEPEATEQITEPEAAPACLPEPEAPVNVPTREDIRREVEAELRLEYERENSRKLADELDRVKRMYDLLLTRNEELTEKINALSSDINALNEENGTLREKIEMLNEENDILESAARSAEERHAAAIERQREDTERSQREADELRLEIEARERQEARERDRIAEAARLAVLEQRQAERELEEARALEESREEERRLEEERIRREIESRATITEGYAEKAPEAPATPEYITKRAKIIFRRAVDMTVINTIKNIIESTLISRGKEGVHIHMKAHQEDSETINLDILKMPAEESELLIAIVKAIGNGKIGVTKIILE